MLNDERLKKTSGDGRADRARDERTNTEDRTLSEQERLEVFRTQPFAVALPDLPPIPGYHTIWLTTADTARDTVNARIRLGYELIKADEIPGFEFASMKTGLYAGYVMVNEMIAAKIPESLYQKYMTHAHHDAPASEEERLIMTQQDLDRQARAAGARVTTGAEAGELDGMEAIKEQRSRRAPVFQ